MLQLLLIFGVAISTEIATPNISAENLLRVYFSVSYFDVYPSQ